MTRSHLPQGARLTGLHALAGSHTASARAAAPAAPPVLAPGTDASAAEAPATVHSPGVVVARPRASRG